MKKGKTMKEKLDPIISISLPQSQMRLMANAFEKVDFSKTDQHPERQEELKSALAAAKLAVSSGVEDLYRSTFK